MRKLGAAALILVALAAISCGKARSPELVHGFVEAARAAGTFRAEGHTTVRDGNEELDGGSFRAEFDLDRRRARFVMDLGYLADQEPATGSRLPRRFESILVEETLYTRIPDEVPSEDGRRWARLPAGDHQALGFQANPLTPIPDPVGFFEMLDRVARERVEVGPDDIRGIATTEYTVVIDLDAAANELPEEVRKTFREATTELGDDLAMRLWVRDDLVHRQSLTMEQDGKELRTTLDLFDYGEPVEIEPPPESETFDRGADPGPAESTFGETGVEVGD